MGKRRAPRVPMSVPILVFGVDRDGLPFGQAAKTIEIGRFGAQIEGLRYLPKPEGILILQCGDKKARFRIVWVGEPGSAKAGRAGVRCLEWGKFGWNVDVPGPAPDPFEHPIERGAETTGDQVLAAARSAYGTPADEGRRQHSRVPCNMALQILREGVTTPLWCNMNDLSTGGCYVVMRSPFPVGTVVELMFRDDAVQIECKGVVRNAETALGMGIEFTDISELDRKKLELLVHKQGQTSQPVKAGTELGLISDKPDGDDRMPPTANFDANLTLELLVQKFRHADQITREDFLQLLQKTKAAPDVHELTIFEPTPRSRVV